MAEVEAPPQVHWHALTKEECFKELGLKDTIRKEGLTDAEAAARLAKYGPNQMTTKEKETLLQKIWKQVNNVLVGILLFVAAISVVRAFTDDPVTNWIQVGIIVGVIAINTAIGIIQEGSAEKAAEALKAMLSSDAILVRNGTETKVPAGEVVPGDVVMLSLGDRVPADLRMIEVGNLASAEAALTGESVPIDKKVEPIDCEGADPKSTPLGDRSNMCFSATLIATGSGAGIVVSTGDYTEIGTINQLVNKVEEKKTAVLEQIDTVSKYLAMFIVVTAIVTWLVAFFKLEADWLEALSISLVCAVAMIPEGLEAIVTVTYAWAVSNMAKQNAIIRALPAVETLGSVTTICSDKTGTLTQNLMSLTAFVTSNARYKCDVDSRDRTEKNFVRDDTYNAERADHAKMIKAKEIIKGGPGVSRHSKKGGAKDFPYTMQKSAIDDNLASEHGKEATVEETKSEDKPVLTDTYPVGQGESPDLTFFRNALAGGVLCSKCTLGKEGGREGEIGNPTELSILRACYWAGIEVNQMKDASPIIAEVPFSSDYKFMATVHESCEANDGPGMEDKIIVHVKGAPDRMIPLCDKQYKAGLLSETEPIDRDYWIEQIAILSSHGLRVLALLRGNMEKGAISEGEQLGPEFVRDRGGPWLSIVGLCAIMDPPRPECVQAVTDASGAGVRVAMITGDHKDTALAIGIMLGLVDEAHSSAITGPELDALSDDELKGCVQDYNVFARASPQNKIRIVKALQSKGEVCGMTGDGVNDAPALKAADMGVAMGKEGTDVAREASDMILADDNFATIVVAVREGRVVWDNLRKVLLVNTPINNAQGMSVLFGLICGLEETPLTAIQVLYCNLICAVTLGFVTAVEPAEDGIMSVPPRRVGKRLIGRYLFLRIALGTIVLVATTVGSTFIAQALYKDENDEDRLELMRSQASNTLTFGACSITVSARFAYNSAVHPRIFYGNIFCWYSIAIVTVLQLAITYIPGLNSVIFGMGPMKGEQWGIVAVCMFITFIVMEIEKGLRRAIQASGGDTDDRDYGYFDEQAEPNQDISLPKGASHLQLSELQK
mmetsp:Transcript_117849/g.176047  ORF Transcript_117849/g.176047 Transcript_117849/m.176047 type:complete len:1063 (-) Transcript_117849:67-3255(-)